LSVKITFVPDNLTVDVDADESILQAATRAGIILRGACGGAGTCGRCRVKLQSGFVLVDDQLYRSDEAPSVFSCRAHPTSDVVIEIPPDARLSEHQVLLDSQAQGRLEAKDEATVPPERPLYRVSVVEMSAPERDKTGDDLSRLRRGLEPLIGGSDLAVSTGLLRELPARLRAAGWHPRCGIADYEPARLVFIGTAGAPYYGIAVDVGTTTVVVQLVDLETGSTVATRGSYNRQAAFGDDVITRIIYATEETDGREHLRREVLETINALLDGVLAETGTAWQNVRACSCAGNPTMVHLLLGVDPSYIRLEPYTPAANHWPVLSASEVGLRVSEDAPVYCLPGVGSYIGGDISGGLVFSGAASTDGVTLFVDIGTNGEIVLGNREWLIGCACSAGPSFEGAGVTCGMRATEGAVEQVAISPGGFEVLLKAIGDVRPVGVCGSGLISGLSALERAGVIDRSGRFSPGLNTPRFRIGADGREFVLAWASESGSSRDLVLTNADLQNLLRAKAAVFAGIQTLLRSVGLGKDDIEQVLIGGGFGRHLNVRDAVAIGMLPDLPPERFRFVGNSSLGGARLALLSAADRTVIEATARRVTYMELDETTPFMDEFMAAMFLPHTDIGLFPSVKD